MKTLTRKIKIFILCVIGEISKLSPFRIIPFFNEWYTNNVVGTPQEKLFFGGRLQRAISPLFFWRTAPLKYKGGRLLNLLGFQALRYIWHNERRKARRSTDKNFQQLRDDGVVIIPDFISEDLHSRLLAFYKKYEHLTRGGAEGIRELYIHSNEDDLEELRLDDFKAMLKTINNELDFDKLYQSITGRSSTLIPFVSLNHYKSFVSEANLQSNNFDDAPHLDGQDTPHKDVFYPAYKCFIYLNDVDENNGAFTYYPKSQKYSPAYAMREYINSIKYYFFMNPGMPLRENVEAFSAVPCSGLKRSAVIFNVAGIHHRGHFRKDKYRERLLLLINFRLEEALFPPGKKHSSNK